jgi:hypothetical protein
MPLFKAVGQVAFTLSTTLADLFKKASHLEPTPTYAICWPLPLTFGILIASKPGTSPIGPH